MVGRRRKNRSIPLAGNHQRCWIWGRNAVLQALESDRWTPVALLAADRLDGSVREQLTRHAHRLGIEIEWTDFDALTNRCRSTEHQGLMAMMPEFPYSSLEDRLIPADGPAFFVVLEGIQDPHNFGAILRSAEVFAVDAVIVGTAGQCDVTPHVARASAGAVNSLEIVRVDAVLEAASWLRERGVRLLGATGTAEREISGCALTGSIALVIGNEGRGLSSELLAACDTGVRIPQAGRTESLNAAVAAGILCYEVRRQRG